MEFINVSISDGIATVMLRRGKVNPLNQPLIEEMHYAFLELEKDPAVKAIVLTGKGKFFSFGFDIPEFLGYSKEDFKEFVTQFTNLYTYLYLFPKPLLAALNGHAIAGGCMIALACDYRLMVDGKAKISLNEISFGATFLAGTTEMLRALVGLKNAQVILYSGDMYTADEAYKLGLVDQVVTQQSLLGEAENVALDLAQKDPTAFSGIKELLRRPIWEEMTKRESDSIHNFIDTWYSKSTWNMLQEIKIHS